MTVGTVTDKCQKNDWAKFMQRFSTRKQRKGVGQSLNNHRTEQCSYTNKTSSIFNVVLSVTITVPRATTTLEKAPDWKDSRQHRFDGDTVVELTRVDYHLTSSFTDHRSFQRWSSQPISWLVPSQPITWLMLTKQESPAIADKPARRESLPKIAPIRRAYNVVADDTGLSSFV